MKTSRIDVIATSSGSQREQGKPCAGCWETAFCWLRHRFWLLHHLRGGGWDKVVDEVDLEIVAIERRWKRKGG